MMSHDEVRVPPPGPSREEVYALVGTVFILAVTLVWWALALWPIDAGGPEWVARTRFVCFGVRGSGLPDASGWTILIGQPLGMLAALFIGWRRGVRSLRSRLRRSARLRLAAAALALAVAAVGSLAGQRIVAALGVGPLEAAVPGAVPSTYPRLDRPAPGFDLVDQYGTQRTLESFRGRPVLLTFAYAHCETVCPLLVSDVLDARAMLRDAGSSPVPAVAIVTLDPWRDTPARLPFVAESWALSGDAFLLGGEVGAVEAALDAWGVTRQRDERTGEVVHPSLIYVLDAQGRIAYAAAGGVAVLVELVKRL